MSRQLRSTWFHACPTISTFLPFAFRIDVNMKNSVYCTAVANGGENEWDFAWDRYQASNVASEKNSLLGSMACTKEVLLIMHVV